MFVGQGYTYPEDQKEGLIYIEDYDNNKISKLVALHPIETAAAAASLLKFTIMDDVDHEMLLLLGVDENDKPVEVKMISRGSAHQCFVLDNSKLAEYMCVSKCRKFILVHNHLSGDLTPSSEDIRSAGTLVQLAALINKELLDSIIISVRRNRFYSLRDEKLYGILEDKFLVSLQTLVTAQEKGITEMIWLGEKIDIGKGTFEISKKETKVLEDVLTRADKAAGIMYEEDKEEMNKEDVDKSTVIPFDRLKNFLKK